MLLALNFHQQHKANSAVGRRKLIKFYTVIKLLLPDRAFK